jgi:hypothetical protein
VARAALHDAHRAVDATGQPVKVESEILWGKPLMPCVTSLSRERA